MAPPVASPESDESNKMCSHTVGYMVICIVICMVISIGTWIYTGKPNGLLLTVVGGSFQMDKSVQGKVTLRFTLRAENPTSNSILYSNISGTLVVLNEHGENADHFLRFNVTDFDVEHKTCVDSLTQVTSQLLLTHSQVTATNISIADNSNVVVLQLNGTMETSSRNSSSVGYLCRIWISEDDEECSRVKKN